MTSKPEIPPISGDGRTTLSQTRRPNLVLHAVVVPSTSKARFPSRNSVRRCKSPRLTWQPVDAAEPSRSPPSEPGGRASSRTGSAGHIPAGSRVKAALIGFEGQADRTTITPTAYPSSVTPEDLQSYFRVIRCQFQDPVGRSALQNHRRGSAPASRLTSTDAEFRLSNHPPRPSPTLSVSVTALNCWGVTSAT